MGWGRGWGVLVEGWCLDCCQKRVSSLLFRSCLQSYRTSVLVLKWRPVHPTKPQPPHWRRKRQQQQAVVEDRARYLATIYVTTTQGAWIPSGKLATIGQRLSVRRQWWIMELAMWASDGTWNFRANSFIIKGNNWCINVHIQKVLTLACDYSFVPFGTTLTTFKVVLGRGNQKYYNSQWSTWDNF